MKRSLIGSVMGGVCLILSACGGSDKAYIGSKETGGVCYEYHAEGNINESAIPETKRQLGLSDANCSREGVVGTCKMVYQGDGGQIIELKFVKGDAATARAACNGEFTEF